MKRALWGMLPVLLLAFWLGAHGADASPIWGDERNSIRDAGGLWFGPLSPGDIWTRVGEGNPWHAPGYFYLLAGWGKVAGWTVPALRLLSLLFGVLTVAWTYRLGADLAGRRAGLYGAAVLAGSMFFAHYLTEARMYTLMAFLSVFTTWAYLRLVRMPKPPRGLWLCLILGAAGLLYTHYFAALTLGALGLYHLILAPKNRRWWHISAALVVAGALFLSWLGTLIAGLQRAAGFDALHEQALGTLEALSRLGYFFGNGYGLLALGSLALAAIPLMTRGRPGVVRLWFLALALLALVLVANAAVQVMHSGRLRYLIGLWPLLALLVGLGLAQLERLPAGKGLAALGLALWVVSGLYQVDARLMSAEINTVRDIYPMQRVAEALRGSVQIGDLIVNGIVVDELPDIDSPLNEYGPMRQFYFPGDTAYLMLQVAGDETQQHEAQSQALDAIGDRPRFWLAYQPENPPSTLENFREALTGRYNFCRTVYDRPDLRVDLYANVPLCCETDRSAPLAQFGDGIALATIQALPAENGALPVIMTWTIDDTVPAYTYSVALHVRNAAGELVAQADYGLELPVHSCKRALLPVTGLPAGEYALYAAVYAWETGARLPATLNATGVQGDLLPVSAFAVE